jgi:hypothetical protein
MDDDTSDVDYEDYSDDEPDEIGQEQDPSIYEQHGSAEKDDSSNQGTRADDGDDEGGK